MNLVEPLRVTNQVRKRGVLSSYLFAVYLDDLFLELNNIKPGCYMVEILLKDLMFADDIYVFWPSVRGLQSILDVCQACAESREIIFNCSKTVCMTFKAKTAISTVIPLLTLGVQRVKSVSHNKHLGIIRDIELSDDKDIQIQLRYQQFLFLDVRTQWKIYFFVPSVRPLYASQLWCDFSKAYFCCDRKSRAACAQSFAPWQQATIEITRRDHSRRHR